MRNKKLLDPKNDYVFKRIFGYVGNEDITKDLINSIIDEPVKSIKLDCKEILEKDLLKDKFGVLDIKAVLNNNIQCDIEMQIVDRKNIESRVLFYWSKMYSKSIKSGNDYIEGKKTIIILFVDYEIPSLVELKKYFSKWHICEDEYKNVVLTKLMEIYIIEMPKYKKYGGNSTVIDTWVKFINNPEVINMDENTSSLKKARKVLEEISASEKEQYLAEQREIYIMDQKAIEAAGYEKGIEKGIEQGTKKGIEKVAKNLKAKNVDIEIIKETTGLTEEEIEKL